ncbi:MAG: hypothetical protein LBK82_14585 [Planctomycetaceae bacterium]|nr:hypothetical protein [Planctomycetaceae bacterium]
MPSVLESMQTLPAQPPSGRIAHLFSCVAHLIGLSIEYFFFVIIQWNFRSK